MPVWLRRQAVGPRNQATCASVVMRARRLSIVVIMLAWVISITALSGGGAALAAIGLIAFAGVAQFLPALMGGIFWRGATRVGALCGSDGRVLRSGCYACSCPALAPMP